MEGVIRIVPLAGTRITKGPGEPSTDARWSDPVEITREPKSILFGRDYSLCDVVFTSGHGAVSGKHFAFTHQGHGQYGLTIFRDNLVYVNGVRAWTAVDPIEDGARINLVSPGGPGFTVEMVRRQETPRGPGVAPTEIRWQRRWQPARLGEALRGVRRAVAGLSAATVVAVAGVLVYVNATRPDTIDADEIALLSSAAYAVVAIDSEGKPRLQGTAWPVAPGVLATNAHVANLFTGHNLMVRRPGGGEDSDFTVTGTSVHPAYDAFARFDAERRRTDTEYAAVAPDDRRSGYDVALLFVADPDNALGPILPRAPAADVAALSAGDEVAYAGYPIAGSLDETSAHAAPTPLVYKAAVTALSDYYLSGTEPAHAYLIQNSLPAFKGASGSPVINAAGEVVGILSGGSVIRTPEGIAANAIMRNFAQRIDLLASLLDGTAMFDVAAEHARWEKRATAFSDFRTGKIEEAKQALLTATGAGSVTEVHRWTNSLAGSAAKGDGFRRYVNYEIPPLARGEYMLLLYGDGRPMVLSAYIDGVRVGFDTGPVVARATVEVANTSTIRVMVDGRASDPVKAFTLYVFRAEAAAS